MRAPGGKFCVKMRPQNCQKLENILGKLRFSFSKTPIFLLTNSCNCNLRMTLVFSKTPIFLAQNIDFLQRLSDFREIQENLLQQLSDFFNGLPLSSILSKYSYHEYFVFPLRTSSYFLLANRHSPHSLASV